MKKRSLNFTAMVLLTIATSMPALAQSLRLEPLANDNQLIRIAADAKEKYLLLPIEDGGPEAQVKVIVNNAQQRLLNIKLAVNKVDYYVPVELDEFRGKEVKLYTHLNRGKQGEAVAMKHIKLSNTFDTTNREKYRPAFHHTPAYGWMNDPNGMFYKDGVWHLYYQYNPYGNVWGNMTWGHSTSKDLINWESQPIALPGDMIGTMFSGSCIVDHDNTTGFGAGAVIAMYTSSVQTPFDCDIQSQCIAYSTDGGYTFTKYEGNPVLTAPQKDFRDPNMFWNEDIKAWNLILAVGQEMRLYSSPDMKTWKEESQFGKDLGCHAGVWECPDLMKLKVKGAKGKEEEKWVLFCNINPGGPSGGSATQYFIGDFDGHKFTVDNEARYKDGAALWQDYGKDHYATVSFSNAPDNRHTMLAWMSNWQYANDVPTFQYRSANSICREPFLYTGKDGQTYLGSKPSPEYDNKGLDKTVKVKGSCTVTLSNEEGEEFLIIYDQKAMTLTVDRSKSGETQFSKEFAVNATAPVINKLTSLRVFIDNSSVEVFGNNGEVCLTSIVFPKSKYNKINVK